ncbi:hypothetical protein GALL_457880 [mine drainage metagenome]|uniref:Uncharacterized protein n=1 Tax=mine drainage metagenome TaxID=410659 RepID=A0A1J5PXP8_9ZZZZ
MMRDVPLSSIIMPRVAMKGGTRNLVMARPEVQPDSAHMARAPTMPSGMGSFRLTINTPAISAQKVISTPTDKSIPEVMMMNVLAMARTPTTVVDCKIPIMLSSVMKASGLSTENTAINAIRLAKASSFCLAWPPVKRVSQEVGAAYLVMG